MKPKRNAQPCTNPGCRYLQRDNDDAVCSRDLRCASPLTEVPLGKQVSVEFVCGQNPLLQNKLLSMGLVPGAVVEVVESAPFGDPLLVQINHCRIALRRTEAFAVEVAEEE